MSTKIKQAAEAAIQSWRSQDPVMKILAPLTVLSLTGFAATFLVGSAVAWWEIF